MYHAWSLLVKETFPYTQLYHDVFSRVVVVPRAVKLIANANAQKNGPVRSLDERWVYFFSAPLLGLG